ncbi:hydrogenase expression/formation protein HypE [Filimonas lacunae]|uniref:Hydrogenase expression/formation protein HypE n=1 Tax=Filimonas lacunae TaxID=477680 RepID=A0A173MEL6_9BACT|nr:hydrogenase expression/formation protein HypE [Filimonas lacunae]BAV05878.1 Ni-Fe hydrogenase metallocenter assembly protein HypE [Filimonas lacunae]SIT34576.1 hydrogenase expression/formation protein HypE [Filimonas lacunae]
MQYTYSIPGFKGALPASKVYQDCVFEILSNKWLDLQHDGVVLSLNGKMAFSTGSYMANPLFFPGGSIGNLAVNGAVNNLAMCGAVAKYISLCFIIEEGLSPYVFKQVLLSIKDAAFSAGVTIVTGDTKVVEKGSCNGLYINTTGIGYVHTRAAIDYKRIQTGDVLVVSGTPGMHGVAMLCANGEDGGKGVMQSDTAPLHEMVFRLLDVFGNDVKYLRDPTGGGIASVLNETAELTNLCFAVDEEHIPIAEEIRNACDSLGIDPLYTENAGILMAVVKKESAAACVALMRNCAGGEKAAIIGEVLTASSGEVIMRSLQEELV